MFYSLSFLLLLFSLTSTGLAQQKPYFGSTIFYVPLLSSYKKKRPPVFFPIVLASSATVLLVLYGVLGLGIFSELPRYLKHAWLFWPIYVSTCLFFYIFLPTWLFPKLSKSFFNYLRPITTLLQWLSMPFYKLCKKHFSESTKVSKFHIQLSEAIAEFDHLIVREIMVPKADIFALPEDMSIQDALLAVVEEGYSRIPLYKKNLDNITGVLLSKDLFHLSTTLGDILQPISNLANPPFYTSEIKKVSSLLQEFRQKHRHLAIVVNEYGFTEGIATMEDILEEVFGDISDEYDLQEDLPYKKLGNSWIVDGKMTISDAEEYFRIKIDHEKSYDTLGGHIVHKIGAVPQKGMKLHHDNFDIEIITCSERSVGKLKLTPRKRKLHLPGYSGIKEKNLGKKPQDSSE